MERQWQDVLDRFSYGIYLVSVVLDDGFNGMVASWVAQCSHDPPLIMLAIKKDRLIHTQILDSRQFCINVLSKDAGPLVKRFKTPDWKHRFDGLDHIYSACGAPVLRQAIGYLDCTLERVIEIGDHTMFVGHVTAGKILNDAKPLTTDDYSGVYRGDV